MEKELLNEEIINKTKEAVKELLEKMGFSCEIEAIINGETDQETLVLDIKSNESNFLIGQHGVNLSALQHLARVVVRKKVADRINFILDVNSYRQEKNDSIVKFAKDMAAQCLSEKRAIVLRPMSPYERRIIHLELSRNDQIRTESIGEGEDRRVVIKPVDLL